MSDLPAEPIYRWLPDDGEWFVSLPGYPGLWATGVTQAAALAELREVYADWSYVRGRLRQEEGQG